MPDGDPVSRGLTGSLVTLPNAITFARLCMVPLAVWLVLRRQIAPAFWLFAAAGLSDALDGWLARRGRGSALGALLDPIADKALLVSMYVTLAAVQVLPDWIAIIVVFRDILIVGGVVVLSVLGQPIAIRPLPVSKFNTLLQIVLVAVALMLTGFAFSAPGLVQMLTWAVAATTLLSGGAYVRMVARPG